MAPGGTTGRSTRERLLDAGVRIFAEKGFVAATVGEIERAAGLQPRRGGLYNHFPSKDALLREAIERQLEAVRERAAGVRNRALAGAGATPPDQIRPLILGVGRWYLKEIDAQRELTLIMEHDGARFPELAAMVREVSSALYDAAATVIRFLAPPTVDAEAHAVVLIASLVGLRRTAWTLGGPPMEVDDERALEAWVDHGLLYLGGAGVTAAPARSRRSRARG